MYFLISIYFQNILLNLNYFIYCLKTYNKLILISSKRRKNFIKTLYLLYRRISHIKCHLELRTYYYLIWGYAWVLCLIKHLPWGNSELLLSIRPFSRKRIMILREVFPWIYFVTIFPKKKLLDLKGLEDLVILNDLNV